MLTHNKSHRPLTDVRSGTYKMYSIYFIKNVTSFFFEISVILHFNANFLIIFFILLITNNYLAKSFYLIKYTINKNILLYFSFS